MSLKKHTHYSPSTHTRDCAAVDGDPLILDRFFPYRLSILATLASKALAHEYATKFDLSIPEWRIIAVLAQSRDVTANTLCARTLMDKVTVSRAVRRLEQARHIERKADVRDRRRNLLRLSASGRAVYRRIAPLARNYEAHVLAVLSEAERGQLDRLLTKLTSHLETFDTAR